MGSGVADGLEDDWSVIVLRLGGQTSHHLINGYAVGLCLQEGPRNGLGDWSHAIRNDEDEVSWSVPEDG